MAATYDEIKELLKKRADLRIRLRRMPYDGSPEVKERAGFKYLYVRKRVLGKLTSTYVGVYDKELYNLLRPKSANILKKLVDNAALEAYVKKIDFNKKEHKEFLTKKLNKTVFGDEKEKTISCIIPTDYRWAICLLCLCWWCISSIDSCYWKAV